MDILDFFNYRPTMKKKEVIDSVPKLKKLVNKLMKVQEFSFDTETNTLEVFGPSKNFIFVGISISWGAYNNYYIPVGHRRHEDYERQIPLDIVVSYLQKVFNREDLRLIAQNMKFDLHVIKRIGINVKTKDLIDTAILSWLCDENSLNGLKENTIKFLRIQQTKFKEVINDVPKEIKKEFGLKPNSKATFDLVRIDDGSHYAMEDSFFTFELYTGFMSLIEHEGMLKVYNKLYKPFILTLFKMEERGVTVDIDKLHKMEIDIAKDIEELEYKMVSITGYEFNPNSSTQLSKILFGYVKEPVHPADEKPRKGSKPFNKLSKEEQEKSVARYQNKLNEYYEELDWCEENSYKFKPNSATDSGSPSTDNNALFKLSKLDIKNKKKQEGISLVKLIMEYKKLAKLNSAFITGLRDKIYDDGKVHPSFNILGTDSGRISCSKPNLQQLPKAEDEDKYQIRSLFIGSIDENTGKRKKIIALDFSNLEMRVLAHYSEDKNLLDMFLNNKDTHGSTAVNMFELPCNDQEVKKQYPHLRQAAKIINFLLMYGGSAPTLYDGLKDDKFNPIDLGDSSYINTYYPVIERKEFNGRTKIRRRNWSSTKEPSGVDIAQIYIDKYFSTYSGVSDFIKNQKKFAKKYGYVQTLLRRKRRLPNINSRNFKEASYCERLSVNSCIQGSAADITSSAQNRVDNDTWFEENGVLMLLQVHDELVFECPEELVDESTKKIVRYMEHPFGDNVELNLSLKVDYDVGDSYQEAK